VKPDSLQPLLLHKPPFFLKALAVSAFPMAALLFIGIVGPPQFSAQRNANQAAVERQVAAHVELETLAAGLQSADASMHDFALTRNPAHLQVYRQSQDRAMSAISRLEALLSGNNAVLDRLHEVANLAEASFDRLAALREYAAAPGGAPAPVLENSRTAVNKLYAALAALESAHSHAAAAGFGARARTVEQQVNGIVFSCIFAGLGGGLLAIGLFARGVRRRDRALAVAADAQVEQAARDLLAASAEWRDRASQSKAAAKTQYRENIILRAVVDGFSDSVIIVDDQGRYLLFNPAAERMFGRWLAFTEAPRLGERYEFRSPGGETRESPLMAALRGESMEGVELSLLLPEGAEPLSVVATARPVQALTGKTRGAFLVLREIAAPDPARNPPEPFNIREALEDAVGKIEECASRRAVSLRAAVGPAWEMPAFAFRPLFTKALEVLLAESIANSPERGAVTISCTETAGSFLRLSFQHSGEPVSQGEIQKLVAGMGRCGAESGNGSGESVWIEIPAAPPQPDLTALSANVEGALSSQEVSIG